MLGNNSTTIIVSIIGAIALIISALISVFWNNKSNESPKPPIVIEIEYKEQVDFLNKIKKTPLKSKGTREHLQAGLMPYDLSYLAAVLDGIGNIARYKREDIANVMEVASDKEITETITATSVVNFGDTLRLTSKFHMKMESNNSEMITKSILRLDIFPKPKDEPEKSFTIITEDFHAKSISKDFSIKYFDHILKSAGFEISNLVHLPDASLEITCLYNDPDTTNDQILSSKGIGTMSML